MATFNGTYENAYAQQLMGEFFGNGLRYFKGGGSDSEYFKPVLSMLDEREIEQRIYDRFGGDPLVKCGVARTCEETGRDPRNGRQYGVPALFYRHDDPVDTLQELWNAKVRRETCRRLLVEIAARSRRRKPTTRSSFSTKSTESCRTAPARSAAGR